MIKLTVHSSRRDIWLNPFHIVKFETNPSGQTDVLLSNEKWTTVSESCEQIAALIRAVIN